MLILNHNHWKDRISHNILVHSIIMYSPTMELASKLATGMLHGNLPVPIEIPEVTPGTHSFLLHSP
jgi:hypothetical protein